MLFAGGHASPASSLNVVSGLRYTRVSADILFDMRLEMYRHLQRLSPRFYARTRLGDVMSRINNDIGEIQRIAAETALAWVGNVLFLVGTVAMLAWLDVRLFLVTVATAPLGIWALVHYRKRLEDEVGALRQRSADIGSFLIETLQAMRLVVDLERAGPRGRPIPRPQRRVRRALMSMQRLSYLSGGLPGLILSAGTGAVFVYGGFRVVEGSITRRDVRRVHGLSDAVSPAASGADGNVREPGDRLGCRCAACPRFSISRSRFRRPRRRCRCRRCAAKSASKTSRCRSPGARRCLEHLSFSIRAGEVVAIVGPSGSGKSTIADLVLRLLDPDSGVVRVDGYDLRTVRLDDLRQRVALVDQEPCMLHATIAENIRYARPDASDAEVAEAARQAALDGFIDTLPQRYETVVGERGMALSAGERQRIALARAFLANPAVLVLDEPSSSLDPENERRIVDGYEVAMRGRTTIVITHRQDLARRADRVLTLEGLGHLTGV